MVLWLAGRGIYEIRHTIFEFSLLQKVDGYGPIFIVAIIKKETPQLLEGVLRKNMYEPGRCELCAQTVAIRPKFFSINVFRIEKVICDECYARLKRKSTL